MREIKFRAWDKDKEKMLEDVAVCSEGCGLVHFFGDFEIMQYTGLKDKNGKEIYEGDLIKDSDSEFIGEVIFDEDTLCFTTKFQANELWGFVPRKGKDNHCEVVGNIYENPEVLRDAAGTK
jgi:uncharacterized phage protein (TIGR01671 family)